MSGRQKKVHFEASLAADSGKGGTIYAPPIMEDDISLVLGTDCGEKCCLCGGKQGWLVGVCIDGVAVLTDGVTPIFCMRCYHRVTKAFLRLWLRMREGMEPSLSALPADIAMKMFKGQGKIVWDEYRDTSEGK